MQNQSNPKRQICLIFVCSHTLNNSQILLSHYFGPVQAKTSSKTRRDQEILKNYGLIFTCLNTSAIHIELSGDLSTNSFNLSSRRFLARRGHVHIMKSDNGTNFVGEVKEINDAIKNLKHGKTITYLNRHQIKWQFNPPLNPWIKGWLEILIKTMKRCLYTILKKKNNFWNPNKRIMWSGVYSY